MNKHSMPERTHTQAWPSGLVVFNLYRNRPDRGVAFMRLVPDPTPRYGPASGRRAQYPCLMSGRIR